jgi:hypothetical protein
MISCDVLHESGTGLQVALANKVKIPTKNGLPGKKWVKLFKEHRTFPGAQCHYHPQLRRNSSFGVQRHRADEESQPEAIYNWYVIMMLSIPEQ